MGLPVILDRYEDFEQYAREAALVTYRPDFYKGPFLDDPQRLRRVTFTAVGVRIRDILLNFSYTVSYEDFYDPKISWDEQVDDIEERISEVIESLRIECGLVRGALTANTSIGEALSIRP